MRFMTLLRSAEGSGPPPGALMGAIAKLGEEGTKAGWLVSTGGFHPTSAGGRVRLSGGKVSTSEGPFPEKEVVGGYSIFEVPSRAEALKLATRFIELHRQHWKGWEGEAEVRQLF